MITNNQTRVLTNSLHYQLEQELLEEQAQEKVSVNVDTARVMASI